MSVFVSSFSSFFFFYFVLLLDLRVMISPDFRLYSGIFVVSWFSLSCFFDFFFRFLIVSFFFILMCSLFCFLTFFFKFLSIIMMSFSCFVVVFLYRFFIFFVSFFLFVIIFVFILIPVFYFSLRSFWRILTAFSFVESRYLPCFPDHLWLVFLAFGPSSHPDKVN